jgi:glycosyltransferase involved in cell wall biosynthesis
MSILIGIDASRANKVKKTGTEWYLYHLIQELKKITPQYRDAGFILYSTESLRGDLSILPPNWESRVLSWPLKRFWTQIRLSWEMWRRPPDILFVPAHTIPIIHPKRVINTCHDLGFLGFSKAYGFFEKLHHKWALNFAIKNTEKIIAVSEFTKNELIKNTKIKPEKVTVIYNSYNSEHYKPISDKSAVRKVLEKYISDFPPCKRGIRGDFLEQTNPSPTIPLQDGESCSPYLLYIGRLEAKKNTLGLVRAFSIFKNKYKSFSNLKLVLVGSPGFGYKEVKKEILNFKNSKRTGSLRHPELVEGSHAMNMARGEISPFGRNDSEEIIAPGWVVEEDLPYLLSAAEAFIYPSFYEGFGIPILEAMACGTPVIASDIPALREIGGEAAHFVNQNSPEEIAEGIYKVLTDENLKNDLREGGLEQVKKFSWEKCVRETMKIFYESTKNYEK